MEVAADFLTYFVILFHLYVVVLECFLWTKPLGLKTFKNTLEKAMVSKVLAFNQGVYNGFLATGLAFSLGTGNLPMLHFILGCVVVAGMAGGWSVHPRIFLIQGAPALLSLLLRVVIST